MDERPSEVTCAESIHGNEQGIDFGAVQCDRGTFGWALHALRMGLKVRRAGWNGKGMWIVLMPSLSLPPFNSQASGAKVNDRTAKHIGPDTPLDSQPYIAMWTAQRKWQPGWLASQADLFAIDWEVV